jgi:hypothetical protein
MGTFNLNSSATSFVLFIYSWFNPLKSETWTEIEREKRKKVGR